MKSVFDSKITTELEAEIAKSNYGLDQIITLASLLERETITDAERPIVAGIIYKRLKNDWPLQIDASVQYAVSSAKCKVQSVKCDWWPILTLNDLEETNSPYNTYKFTGLPPAPIASPGISSIRAAISPEESSYWYYIHADGQIYYAKTLAEHNQNVRVYLNK
ncbi:endolytic transglycosylase MltG, partial [Patescibacteria group bacterium]|nr:endolytic transglycosylase MltG [Patescibacteria group bacterium]